MQENQRFEITASPPTSKRLWGIAKMLALGVFLGGLFCFFRFTEIGRSIQPTRFVDQVAGEHPLFARLAYVVIYILGTVLLVPGTVLSFAGALLFGAYEGTLYTWLGATLGATLSFLVARWLGRDAVASMLGQRLTALDDFVRRRGFWGILLLRLLPIFPFNLINFGSGLTGIRLRDYVAATAIGILPGTFVYQLLFAKVGRRALDQGISLNDLRDPYLLWPVGLFIGFLAVGMVVAHRFKRHLGRKADNSR